MDTFSFGRTTDPIEGTCRALTDIARPIAESTRAIWMVLVAALRACIYIHIYIHTYVSMNHRLMDYLQDERIKKQLPIS